MDAYFYLSSLARARYKFLVASVGFQCVLSVMLSTASTGTPIEAFLIRSRLYSPFHSKAEVISLVLRQLVVEKSSEDIKFWSNRKGYGTQTQKVVEFGLCCGIRVLPVYDLYAAGAERRWRK